MTKAKQGEKKLFFAVAFIWWHGIIVAPMKQIITKVTPTEHAAIKAEATENNRTINQQMRHYALSDSSVQERLARLMRGKGKTKNPYQNANA